MKFHELFTKERLTVDTTECDLLVIGGGPAGLSAAINGASEGLKVILMDSGPELGGQAVRSSLIENYPGFPDGISGHELLGRFVRQAQKFHADILCPQTAVSMRADGRYRIVTSDDEQVFSAKIVILSLGLSYKRLGAPGVGALMGRGALYGSPTTDAISLGSCTICIIGGANSAGQAAMDLSRNPAAKIKILIRKNIEVQMSHYLVSRIRNTANIEIVEGVEVTQALGEDKLRSIIIKKGDGTDEEMPTNHLFIFIGATPKTFWLQGTIKMDEKKFILTGPKLVTAGLWQQERPPLSFETSMPGVFACGDVRVGSIKRAGSAVGEGIATLAMCHEYLRLLNGH